MCDSRNRAQLSTSAAPPPPEPPPPPPPPPPPSPPPLQQSQTYATRATSALARFAQPFFTGSRPPSPHSHGRRDDVSTSTRSVRSKSLNRLGTSRTFTHRTGLSIASLDISPQKTHVVIAGREIFQTICVASDGCSEGFDIRHAILTYPSTHHVAGGPAAKHKDQLAIRDVKWSRGKYDTILATAAGNGRVVIYDLHHAGLELARFNGHSRQVHRLAFNPHFPAYLLSASQDATVRMWDLRLAFGDRGVAICSSNTRYPGNSDVIRDIRWSPSDGVVFATATDGGAIQCWDYRKTNAPFLRIAAHDRPCYSVDWHPDGKHLASGGTDRLVKVWDFSAERKQKPSFQFRTPQAVYNVRWRPPACIPGSHGQDDLQSTQLVTSYDKEDPRVHLWDLRRLHIPSREFNRDDSLVSDLLWHSKDLLWTVTTGGAFIQADIKYAPQVVNRRPVCAVAWSPTGDVLTIAQRRPRRRMSTTEFLDSPRDEDSSNGDGLAHPRLADDSLDETADSTSFRHRPNRVSGPPSKTPSTTPPSTEDPAVIIPLEKVVIPDKCLGPRQLGVVGRVAGTSSDPALFRYLARQYRALMKAPDTEHPRRDAVPALLDALDHNAGRAEEVSPFKFAQTWKMVKYAIIQELQLKAQENQRPHEPDGDHVRRGPSGENDLPDRSRHPDDARPDKMRTRMFKTAMEKDGQRGARPEVESTSAMATPLAQPLPDLVPDSRPTSSSRVGPRKDDLDLQPLPPSLLSAHHYDTVNSHDAASHLDGRSLAPFHHESGSSEDAPALFGGVSSDQCRELAPEESSGNQRSAPRAIEGRADWRRHLSQDSGKAGSEEDYDQRLDDAGVVFQSRGFAPKGPLVRDRLASESAQRALPAQALRHDSSDSIPMFSASTDGSQRVKSTETSLPGTRPSMARSMSESWSTEDEYIAEHAVEEGAGSHSLSLLRSNLGDPLRDMSFDESGSEANNIHLERPSSPLPLLVEPSGMEAADRQSRAETPSESGRVNGFASSGMFKGVRLPLIPEMANSKPWSAQVILREAIRHYCSGTHADLQMATHLLLTLHTLFYAGEILPYGECESIFKSYHEHLQRHSMYVEAAELRLLCVPTYPTVYEYAQADTFINVFCYNCKRSYENPTLDNRRCYRCNTTQEPCPICLSLDPPTELVTGLSASFTSLPLAGEQPNDSFTSHSSSSPSQTATELIPTSEIDYLYSSYQPCTALRPYGAALWSWCQGCGHGGHLACVTAWLSDVSVSEGGCATPGCMHDCGPGPLRDESLQQNINPSNNRSGTGSVKQDKWATCESKAVETVRGMLTVEAAAATAARTSLSSGGVISPKKVRLVTPSEQGKRNGSGINDGGGGVTNMRSGELSSEV